MQYEIRGDLAQIARVVMNPDDVCWASKGALITYDPGIEWHLKVPGGVEGAARRMFSGEGVALTHITTNWTSQQAVLGANEPGKIVEWDLADGAVVTTRGSFVAAFGSDVVIDVTVARRAGAAFFGGAGLFLQNISGDGIVLVHGAGDFIDRVLAPNETIVVSTGNLAAFANTVDYAIQGVGGCLRMLFGGEGLFLTRLTGPGRVLLQTLKRRKLNAQTQTA